MGAKSSIHKSQRQSIFSRLNKKANNAKGDYDVKSVIPSKMTRAHEIDIVKQQPLTAKARIIVSTNQKRLRKEVDEVVASHHVTIHEVSNDEEEVETDEAPESLEDGGQATVDDLKELNLGTPEEPRPVYVSALLSETEEQEYYSLLSEYKDAFAWSYIEMPGLSPKVAVHRLGIKRGFSPKKQPQRGFRP